MFSLQHQSCSARMGSSSDPNSVVDPQLKVHVLENLRVVDASVVLHPKCKHQRGIHHDWGESR